MRAVGPRRALGALLAIAACGDGSGDGGGTADARPDGFDRTALLRSFGETLVRPLTARFATDAATLATAIPAACAAIGGDTEAELAAAAQDAWRDAATTWHTLEAFQLGPVTMDGGTLHDRIDSWPVVSGCAVDQEVVALRADPAGYDLSLELVNRRGLPALEYLLFAASLDTVCPPQVAPAGWNDLPDVDRRRARCAFAGAASRDLGEQADTVAAAWAAGPSSYVDVLAGAGDPGNPYASPHEGVNALSDALFYVDNEVKDMKLGEPAGISVNSCGAIDAPCLAELESPHARHGKEQILANLRGLRLAFRGDGLDGPADPGFDDFLVAVGSTDLATAMSADIDAAIAAVEAIPVPLEDAVTSARPSVIDAHAAVKKVTDQLKSQFLAVLSLDLPDASAGDND